MIVPSTVGLTIVPFVVGVGHGKTSRFDEPRQPPVEQVLLALARVGS